LNAKTVQDELFSSEKLTLPAKRLERGDVKKAVEVALREWPNKSQQEIAEQVGCSQFTVHSVQKELIAANMLTLPAKRMGKDGKERPTAYATRTTRTATSATFNPVLDGGEAVNTPGAGPGAHVSNSARGPFQAWALDCVCAERAGTGAGAGTSARTSCRTSAAPGTVRGMMPEDCPSIHDRGAYRRGHPPGPPPEGVGCPLARPGFRLGKA
jgi:hypothetical protein